MDAFEVVSAFTGILIKFDRNMFKFNWLKPSTKPEPSDYFIKYYKYSLTWPVSNTSTIHYIAIIVVFLQFAHSFLVQGTYNLDKLGLMERSDTIITIAAEANVFIRVLYRFLHKNQFKIVVKDLYEKICFSREVNTPLYDHCERQINMMYSVSKQFFLPLILFSLEPCIALFKNPQSNTKPFVYPAVFFYNEQSVLVYITINASFVYLVFYDVCVWNADDTFLYKTLCFTSARYIMLHADIDDLEKYTIQSKIFEKKLKSILKEQQILLQ